MKKIFYNESSELLYKKIISINKDIMLDEESISLKKHCLINEGSLINLCNMVYGEKPFTNGEAYCKDFAEMTARIIFHLNKSHCFSDGNKRTSLLIIMDLIKEDYPIFYNEFFRGGLSIFLIEMIKNKLTYDDVLKWVYQQYRLRYDISDEEDSLLKISVNFKRNGLYEEAKENYKKILAKYGPSSLVYNGIAKVLACEEKYEEAIKMFKTAIYYAEKDGIYDFQSTYHKKMLENRYEMKEDEFLCYLKSISGNSNYEFKEKNKNKR